MHGHVHMTQVIPVRPTNHSSAFCISDFGSQSCQLYLAILLTPSKTSCSQQTLLPGLVGCAHNFGGVDVANEMHVSCECPILRNKMFDLCLLLYVIRLFCRLQH